VCWRDHNQLSLLLLLTGKRLGQPPNPEEGKHKQEEEKHKKSNCPPQRLGNGQRGKGGGDAIFEVHQWRNADHYLVNRGELDKNQRRS